MPDEHQIALESLILAFDDLEEVINSADRIAFLRAIPHERLAPLQSKLVCEQPFKPRAAALDAAHLKNVEHIEGTFDIVLLLPERQREQTLADIARGFSLLKEGGTLVMALHNDWGAKRFEKHVAEVAGEVSTFSKNHCRVFWAEKTPALDASTLAEWATGGGLRRVLDGKFWSKPGFFSWDHIDDGSALLVEHLPATLSGRGADLGAGWGYLSHQVAQKCPDIDGLDLYEADREALEAARRNLGLLPIPFRPRYHWSDVPNEAMHGDHDFVIMNPPFHDGRAADHLLGMKFIAAAARALDAEGELWMVANRHLPYEHLMEEAFTEYQILAQDNVFKILHGRLPKQALNPRLTRERKGKWAGKLKKRRR